MSLQSSSLSDVKNNNKEVTSRFVQQCLGYYIKAATQTHRYAVTATENENSKVQSK